MLKERQIAILSDLEKTQVPIPALFLAQKYNVSIRTIRNDINEIDYVVKQYGGKFIRLPNKGMRIRCSVSISDALSGGFTCDTFSNLERGQQLLVLCAVFLSRTNPLTASFLSDSLSVSTGTIMNRIRDLTPVLEKYSMQLKGIKKKGFYLNGKAANLISLLDEVVESLHPDVLKTTFFASSSPLAASEEENIMIHDLILFMEKELTLSFKDSHSIYTSLFFVVRNAELLSADAAAGEPVPETQNSPDSLDPLCGRLFAFLLEKHGLSLHRFWQLFLRHVLLSCTNAVSFLRSEANEEENSSLKRGVSMMVRESLNYFPELKEDAANLESDLLTHLSIMLKRMRAKLDNSNPLLSDIKIHFPVTFSTVKELSKTFSLFCSMPLDEDQLGYITLYFAQYLEKKSQKTPVRALIICNSGAGAAKLLSTKVRNHFPDISIVGTNSSFNLESGKIPLAGIDLILSTVKINPSIGVPVITVSPFLSNDELLRIRRALLQTDGNRDHESAPFPLHASPSPTVSPDSSASFSEGFSPLTLEQSGALLYAEIVVDVFNMLREIYPDEITADNYSAVAGIITHVLLSLPRWAAGDFIRANDYEELRAEYPEQFRAVMDFLNALADKLRIFIAPIEVSALLRYLL